MTPSLEPHDTASDDASLVRASWARAAVHAPVLLAALLDRLAEIDPGARARFPDRPTDAQARAAAALGDELVASLDEPRRLVRDIVRLARGEAVPLAPSELRVVTESLLHALDRGPGGPLSPAEHRAWCDATRLACSIAGRASGAVASPASEPGRRSASVT